MLVFALLFVAVFFAGAFFVAVLALVAVAFFAGAFLVVVLVVVDLAFVAVFLAAGLAAGLLSPEFGAASLTGPDAPVEGGEVSMGIDGDDDMWKFRLGY